nr:uncharacterized protein LOC109150412 [Ipomoea batatas]
MVKMLRFCDKKVQFWYEYGNTRIPKLMKLSSDADIIGLVTDILVNKELDIYAEHLYDDQWDYHVEISRELGDDTLLHDGVLSEDESCDNDYGNQADVECNLSEQVLRRLCDSDSNRAIHRPINVFEERNLKNEGFKFVIGMVFSSSKEFKWAVQYHEAMRQKDVMFKKNEARRVRLTRNQAYLAKKKALKQIDGLDSEQFKELNDYYEELRRSNPGTTVKNEARQSYDPVILPIRALELWHKTAMPLPPKYKPQPGRPKKKRKIDPVVEKPDQKKGTKKVHVPPPQGVVGGEIPVGAIPTPPNIPKSRGMKFKIKKRFTSHLPNEWLMGKFRWAIPTPPNLPKSRGMKFKIKKRFTSHLPKEWSAGKFWWAIPTPLHLPRARE